MKIKAQAGYIRTGEEKYIKIIQRVTDFQVSLLSPKNFDPSDSNNYISLVEKSFENLCTTLEEWGIVQPHRLTVFQFYSKIRYFKEKKSKSARK